MEQAIKWLPVTGLDVGCADISFSWASEKGAMLCVLMHFSRVIDGRVHDLELKFRHVCAMNWEDERFGIIEVPSHLPKCSSERFRDWTHPTLIIENSAWAMKYAARQYSADEPQSKKMVHYFLVSLNDLVHILAESVPEVRWVAPAP